MRDESAHQNVKLFLNEPLTELTVKNVTVHHGYELTAPPACKRLPVPQAYVRPKEMLGCVIRATGYSLPIPVALSACRWGAGERLLKNKYIRIDIPSLKIDPKKKYFFTIYKLLV